MGFSWWGGVRRGRGYVPARTKGLRVQDILDRLRADRRRDRLRTEGATAEYIILEALVLEDDVLTAAQLAARTTLTTQAAREALLSLGARGLATAPAQGAGWAATAHGRGEWSRHPERHPRA